MITPDLLARLCRARAELQSALETPPRVAAVARRSGLSAAHFITQFRAVFGETPVQCRTRARMNLARQMLAATDEPVTQIALSLGFGNTGSFSRAFHLHTGMAPSEWRRQRSALGGHPPAGCIALMNQAWARQPAEIPAKR